MFFLLNIGLPLPNIDSSNLSFVCIYAQGVLTRFCGIHMNILKHCKRKHTWSNKMSLITKDLSKTIMKRSKLCSKFLQNRTGKNKVLHTKQRNQCIPLLKKFRKKCFTNLNEKYMSFLGRQ